MCTFFPSNFVLTCELCKFTFAERIGLCLVQQAVKTFLKALTGEALHGQTRKGHLFNGSI